MQHQYDDGHERDLLVPFGQPAFFAVGDLGVFECVTLADLGRMGFVPAETVEHLREQVREADMQLAALRVKQEQRERSLTAKLTRLYRKVAQLRAQGHHADAEHLVNELSRVFEGASPHFQAIAARARSLAALRPSLRHAERHRVGTAARSERLTTFRRQRASLASRSGRGSPPIEGPSALSGEARKYAPDRAPDRASHPSRRGTSYPAADSPCPQGERRSAR